MSELRSVLLDSTTRIFTKLCTRELRENAEQGTWPQQLWQALEHTGLTDTAKIEARGGAGADVHDVLALVRLAGNFAVPLPLAENFLAELALARGELPPIAGPLTAGPVIFGDAPALERGPRGWTISGTLHRLPWARYARAAVVIAKYDGEYFTAVVHRPTITMPACNYAGEPRDTVQLDNVVLPGEAVSSRPGFTFDEFYFAGALFRAVAMAGALERVLDLTVLYANERIQFGRPIGKFQAIQQQIAVLASQVAAASAAADAAVDASGSGVPACFEIAAAKSRVGEAAGLATAIAHQVHGAMGFTREHPLNLSTRRLLAWRDEFGAETEWAGWIGRVVSGVGGEGLWAWLTNPRRPHASLQLIRQSRQ